MSTVERKKLEDSLLNTGISYYNLYDYDNALKMFQQVLKINENNLSALFFVSALHDYRENYSEAVRYADRALSIDPRNVRSLELKGSVLSKMGQYAEAENVIDKALSLDPKNAQLWYTKGVILNSMNRLEESIAALSHSLELDPNNTETYNTMGKVLYEKRDYDNSLIHFERALQLDYENIEALSYIGNIYLENQDYDKALKYYEKAIDLGRTSGNLVVEQASYRNIGRIYSALGDQKKAIKSINNSLNINLDINNKYGLLQDYVSLGDANAISEPDYHTALNYYNKAMEITRQIGDKKLGNQVNDKIYEVNKKIDGRPSSNLV